MLPEELTNSLSNLESFLLKKPKNIYEALTYESEKQFILYAIQLAKAKLINDNTNESINKINLLKEINDKIKKYKEYKDTEYDSIFINELYNDK